MRLSLIRTEHHEQRDTFPRRSVTSYDVTSRQDTDYYADVSDADRAAWDRARAYVDEIAPRMADAWDRAEYPLEAARRMGDYDLVIDGVDLPSPACPRSPRAW